MPSSLPTSVGETADRRRILKSERAKTSTPAIDSATPEDAARRGTSRRTSVTRVLSCQAVDGGLEGSSPLSHLQQADLHPAVGFLCHASLLRPQRSRTADELEADGGQERSARRAAPVHHGAQQRGRHGSKGKRCGAGAMKPTRAPPSPVIVTHRVIISL